MSTERIWFRVHGRVQMVNFRNFTKDKADELGVSGWVQNSASSGERVEGEAQGAGDAIASFLKAIDRGPTHAHVAKLEKGELDVVEDETGFLSRRRGPAKDVAHHK